MSGERRAWALRYIEVAPGAPAYGTPEWVGMPDGPAKVAAVVRAAECWVMEGEEYPQRLTLELETVALTNKHLDDAEWVERGREHELAWDPRLPGYRRDLQGEAQREREWLEFIAGGDESCQDAPTRRAS